MKEEPNLKPKQENVASDQEKNIQEVFKSFPDLEKIGTCDQYEKYLEVVFPESKTRNVVHHGSNKTFNSFKDNADIYFSSDLEIARGYQEKYDTETSPSIKNSILNVINPYIIEGNNSDWFKIIPDGKTETRSIGNIVRDGKELGHDGVFIRNVKDGLKPTNIVSDIYVVFKPEQIHVLGSVSDIEGFKKFVASQSA